MRDLQLRQEIIACTSEMFRKAGARDLTDGFNTAASLFENLAAQLRQLDTEEKFEAVLDKLPEPGKTERTGIRAALRFGPHLFRYAISRLASEARNEFPKPPGGRSHTFGPRRRV